jgi:putative Holliday junction resolvase
MARRRVDPARGQGRLQSRSGERLKVLALDYGSARTGVAVSDPTGSIARPVGVVERVGTAQGLARLLELVRTEGPERIVVGMPLTLRGERGAQAQETERFLTILRRRLEIPVETFDERLTTALAARSASSVPEDARAAAHLLDSYLTWLSRRDA